MIRALPWIAAAAAAGASLAFALLVRLPFPFPGFAALAAAGLAGLGTLALVAWMPRAWLWTEAERLRFAFQARHGLPENAAQGTLETITAAHARATALRQAAGAMRADVAAEVGALADRLDAAAREIFYVPARRRALASVLTRSELIEEAAQAHAALRQRNQAETEAASREKLQGAMGALAAAFDQTDLLAAQGLLQEVEVASDVAETLLTPRRRLTHPEP